MLGHRHGEAVLAQERAHGRGIVPIEGGGPGGASRAAATASRLVRHASAIAPSGIQALIASRPFGAATLAISAAAASASGAKITPNTETSASAAPSARGIEAASPSANSIERRSARARAAATSSSRGAGSTPVTRAPRAAAISAALPVPQPRSTSVSPSAGAAASTTAVGGRKQLRRDLLVVAGSPVHRASS